MISVTYMNLFRYKFAVVFTDSYIGVASGLYLTNLLKMFGTYRDT